MKHLSEGETLLVQGSAKKPYEIKMIGGVCSCSCVAWRLQSLPIDQRTCKHIKANVSNGFGGTNTQTSFKPAEQTAKKNIPPCLLAHTWDKEIDVTGWAVAPKLDGLRTWWDGKTFWSRLGNKYHAPEWFLNLMPKNIVLDGELFAGNGKFQEAVSIVRKGTPVDEEWKQIKFMVFDTPNNPKPFLGRVDDLKVMFSSNSESTIINLVAQDILVAPHSKTYKDMVAWWLDLYEKQGYEGIMLRDPNSFYEPGRSHTLLKVKSFLDCEVTVLGYQKGKGRHKGTMGSLDVKMDSGVEFNVGSGFTDEERRNPPKIGSKITIKYQELSRDSVPRFPTYYRAYIR